MTDNPYINKQNWGQDLLNRINNLTEDDGSLNVWTSLPTLGKDGIELNQSHKGYTGALCQDGIPQKIIKWNGNTWETIISSSSIVAGESYIDPFVKVELFALSFSAIAASSSIYIISTESAGNTYLCRYDLSGTLLWKSLIPTGDPLANGYVSSRQIEEDVSANRVYMILDKKEINPTSKTWYYATCVSLSNGTLNWQTLLHSTTSTEEFVNALCLHESRLFVSRMGKILYELNPASGSLVTTFALSWLPVDNQTCFLFASQGGLIMILRHGGNAFLVNLSYANMSLTYQIELETLFNAARMREFFYDGVNNIYMLGENASNETCVALFTSQTNEINLIAKTSSTQNLAGSYIVDAYINGGELFVEMSKGYMCSIYRISNNTITFFESLFPLGEGSIIKPKNIVLQQKTMVCKVSLIPYGANDDSARHVLTLCFSEKQLQVNLFKSVNVFTEDARSCNASVSADSLFSTKGAISSLVADKISVLFATPVTADISSTMYPDNNIKAGSYLTLSSIQSWAAGISAEDVLYPGGKYHVSTVGFNCETLAGRIVNSLGTPMAQSAAMCLYDLTLGKLVIDFKPVGTISRVKQPGFIRANPCITAARDAVGILNFAPAYPLDVTGTIRGTEVRNSGGVITSDPRLKTNMTSLNGGELWEVCQLLNPITFVYKPDFEVEIQEITKDEDDKDVVNTTKSKWPLPQGIQYGYNAVEVEELLPELVDEDPQGIKYLNAGALFPIFQAAATSKIQSLESEVESLKQLVQSLVTRIEVLENA